MDTYIDALVEYQKLYGTVSAILIVCGDQTLHSFNPSEVEEAKMAMAKLKAEGAMVEYDFTGPGDTRQVPKTVGELISFLQKWNPEAGILLMHSEDEVCYTYLIDVPAPTENDIEDGAEATCIITLDKCVGC